MNDKFAPDKRQLSSPVKKGQADCFSLMVRQLPPSNNLAISRLWRLSDERHLGQRHFGSHLVSEFPDLSL